MFAQIFGGMRASPPSAASSFCKECEGVPRPRNQSSLLPVSGSKRGLTLQSRSEHSVSVTGQACQFLAVALCSSGVTPANCVAVHSVPSRTLFPIYKGPPRVLRNETSSAHHENLCSPPPLAARAVVPREAVQVTTLGTMGFGSSSRTPCGPGSNRMSKCHGPAGIVQRVHDETSGLLLRAGSSGDMAQDGL